MTQPFNIQNDTVVINNLSLSGTANVDTSLSITQDLTVCGTITADQINVKTIISDAGEAGSWVSEEETDLNGKGFTWSYSEGSTYLIYRTGNRLWCNGSIDLDAAASYKIDNTEVINVNSLGSSVVNSKLRTVGKLNSLTVIGDTSIGEFAYFNTVFNRLGLGTDEPNASISIVDNDVEISIGSPKNGLAIIGTHSNHDLEFITDNTARISIKSDGEVHIGDFNNKSATLRVYGSIYAENIVTDTRLERTSPLEFTTSRDTGIYGKGLIWTGSGPTKQLVMMANPDRLMSTESIEIGQDQSYYINGVSVLTETSLGDGIINSKLTSIGTLESLRVSGNAQLASVTVETISVNEISLKQISSYENISINASNLEVLYADSTEISIGDRKNSRKPVKVFGPLSVGISNPDPSVSLSVNGNFSFSNKKFITGTEAPTTGSYIKGDICWNQNPQEDSYIGWVCVVEGDPGIWAPFGIIGH